MENKKKVTMVWVIVILVLIVGAVLFFNKKNEASQNGIPDTASEPESTEDISGGSAISGTGSSMTYTQAVAAYSDRRIQLDKTCQAHPNNVTYKNGTSIMVDNRSASPARVRLGSTFTIKPYAFKIVKLSSATLPATLLVDCGASQNVATVLIQK